MPGGHVGASWRQSSVSPGSSERRDHMGWEVLESPWLGTLHCAMSHDFSCDGTQNPNFRDLRELGFPPRQLWLLVFFLSEICQAHFYLSSVPVDPLTGALFLQTLTGLAVFPPGLLRGPLLPHNLRRLLFLRFSTCHYPLSFPSLHLWWPLIIFSVGLVVCLPGVLLSPSLERKLSEARQGSWQSGSLLYS